jgi:hypothetical protein
MTSRWLLTVLVVVAALQADSAERQLNESRRFPAAEGKRVVVDVGSLNLRVRAADVENVEVLTELRIAGVSAQKAENWIEANTPVVDDGEDELRISATAGKMGVLSLGHLTARSRLGVILPPFVAPDLTTTNSPIRVRGNIKLRGGAREVEVDTASGTVWIGNLSGPVRVETSTGRITLQWDRLDPDDHIRVRSASGRIELILPPGVEPRGSLVTTTGSIRCDFPGEWNDREDTLRLTGDGPLFEVETASSEISAYHRHPGFD